MGRHCKFHPSKCGVRFQCQKGGTQVLTTQKHHLTERHQSTTTQAECFIPRSHHKEINLGDIVKQTGEARQACYYRFHGLARPEKLKFQAISVLKCYYLVANIYILAFG